MKLVEYTLMDFGDHLWNGVGGRFQSLVGWDVGGPGEGRMPVGEGAGLPAGRGESARARHPLCPLSHSLSLLPSCLAG